MTDTSKLTLEEKQAIIAANNAEFKLDEQVFDVNIYLSSLSIIAKDLRNKVPQDAEAAVAAAKLLPNTDYDACQWFIKNIAPNLNFTESLGWMIWDGHIWRTVDFKALKDKLTTPLMEGLLALSHAIASKLPAADDKEAPSGVATAHQKVKATRAFALGLKSSKKRYGLARYLHSELTGHYDPKDPVTDIFVLADGQTIYPENLKYSEVSGLKTYAPNPTKQVFQKARIDFKKVDTDPDAWQAYLDLILPNKEEQLYLQRVTGAMILGKGRAKNIPVFKGAADTGKSSFANILLEVLGYEPHNYGIKVGAEVIEAKRGGSNFGQSDLRGKRLVLVEEPRPTDIDTSFLKDFTGGGLINSDRKNQSRITFRSQAILMITSNADLSFKADKAMSKRLDKILMTTVFSEMNPDPRLRANPNIASEMFDKAGLTIFKWMLEGVREYFKVGAGTIPRSESMADRRQASEQAQSSAIEWASTMIQNTDFEANECYRLQVVGDDVKRTELAPRPHAHRLYRTWCEDNGIDPLKSQTWQEHINGYTGVTNSDPDARLANGVPRLQRLQLVYSQGHEECAQARGCKKVDF